MSTTDLPATMRAAVLMGQGGPEMLVLRDDVPVPAAGPGEVLIKVAACGVNNTDINTRVGWYSKSVTGATADSTNPNEVADDATWGSAALAFPRIQGADPSGRIVAVGAGVDPARVGERVLGDPWVRDIDDPDDRTKAGYRGSEHDGGFAEYCTMPSINAYAHTSELSDVELATLPCSWSTAEHMLQRVRLEAGQSVAITGASGGVGSALIQLAKLRDAHVTAICGATKIDAVTALGADEVIARSEPIPAGPFDVVCDVVGGPSFPDWLEALTRGGRYVTAGAIAGPIVDLDLRTLYLNDLELHGTTVFRPQVFADLMSYVQAGRISPVVGGTYPLEDIHAAQTAFGDKTHVGALVITL